jgi:hypothetical protein
MRASTDHVLTSHVGSLPRPDSLIAAKHAHDPPIAWAKLESLAQGAALASRALWG